MAQPTSPTLRPSPYRYLVFGLLALAYLLVYFHRTSPGVVSVELERDLGAGPSLLGLLGAAYFWPYALMQLPAGLLSDSWGPRRTVTVSFLLAGASSVLFGLAQGVTWAILARTLVGLGVALLFVPTLKIMTRWFKVEEFARMTGILMAVGGMGVLSAAGPLAYLSAALGWRFSFLAIGGFTIALAVAIWFLVRNQPEELGLPPLVDPAAQGAGQAERIPLAQGVRRVLGHRPFWPLAIWFFFSAGTFFSFGGLWGGHYLRHVHGLSQTQAGNVLNMLAVAMILGSPFLSWLSDKVVHSRKKVLVAASLGLVLLTGLLALFPASPSLPLLYVWFFCFSVCSSAIVTIGFTSNKELFPVSIAGTATGLVNFSPFLGGAVMQWGAGLILQAGGGDVYDASSFRRVFVFYCAASVVALICSFLAKDTYRAPAN